MKRSAFIGERFINNKGCTFEIIGYEANNYRTIKFDSGYICSAHISNITRTNCTIKDWMSPSVYGVGIVGEPGLRYHPLYIKWRNMIGRCYNPKNTYFKYYGAIGIKMSDELLNFKSFIAIVEKLDNYEKMIKEPHKWQIDKDLKSIGQKMYTKDTITIMTAKENQWLATAEHHRDIYQYDINGNFISKYNNLLEVIQQNNYDMSCIDHAIFGKYRHAYGYIWLDENNISELKQRVIFANSPKKTTAKVIYQINQTTNEIINVYNSVQEACHKNNFKSSNIAACCRGEQKTAYGYVWKYKGDE